MNSRRVSWLIATGLIYLTGFCASAQTMSYRDIEKLPRPKADYRIPYGTLPLQFGELRLPKGKGPFPVVVVIHGGCWFSAYDLNHLASFTDSLTRQGFATWTIEYRRVGDPGGGWPGTFQDVASGTDYVARLTKKYNLDSKRIVVIGHSAGGQLALWLASRNGKESMLSPTKPVKINGVVSLAGIADMRSFIPACDDSVRKLLGGGPEQFPDRFKAVSPMELPSAKVPVKLVHGAKDVIVPKEQAIAYDARSRKEGAESELLLLPEAGHFELVSPSGPGFDAVVSAIRSLLQKPLH